MTFRALSIVVLALALPVPAFAQDRKPATPAPQPAKIVCSFCGATRDGGETCPFCGGKETSPTPSTEKPAADSDKDLPKVAPTPKLIEKDPTPAPAPRTGPTQPQPAPKQPAPKNEPAVSAPKDAGGAPAGDDDGLDEKARRAYQDDNMAKGDYYFKTGYYLKASEAYRVAVLAEPVNPWKKLAFGHALFAIGNYSYSSYALRRAVSQLDPKTPFTPDVASLFPSKKAFEKAIKDLKRYVTYSPRDAAGLSVLGYMLFAQGEDDRAKEMFVYLQRLPKNDADAFADFFLKQIEARKGGEKTPDLTPPKPVQPEPPKAAPAPPQPTPSVTTPEGAREEEEKAKVKPAPAKAIAE